MAKKKAKVVDAKYEEMIMNEKIANCKNKLYSEEKKFNCFEYFGSFALDKIKAKIETDFPESEYPMHSLKRYLAVATYLGSQNAKKDFISFDDRMAFLIQAIDPDLSIYYGYLNIGYSLNDKDELAFVRAGNLIAHIKSIIGTFDGQFLKYEEMYFQRFLKEGSIISFVNKDCYTKFFASIKDVHSFKDATQSELKMVMKEVETFFASCQDPQNINSVCFNICNPNTILKLYGKLQRAIFVVLALDPELNVLRVYAEESNLEHVKNRMIQEFGFFHEDFVKLEEAYRRRFCPDRVINECTLN